MRRKNNVANWIEEAKQERVKIDVTNTNVREIMKMLNLTEYDLQLLKKIRPLVFEEISEIATNFYAKVYRVDKLKAIIDAFSSVEKLSKTLARHVMEIFDGTIDEAFLDRRYHVGKMHYRIRLTPSYYMGAFQLLKKRFVALIFRELEQPELCERLIEAIDKMLTLEQQVVLAAYDTEYEKTLKAEFEEGRNALRESISTISEELGELTKNTNESITALNERLNAFLEINGQEREIREQVKKRVGTGSDQLNRLLTRVGEANVSIKEMGAMVVEMNNASEQISQVTQLVKGLADQTNILALNSAIEAARAGEYGKGFTVVSEEIRKLSEKTNRAMAQITELVSRSVEVAHSVNQSLESTRTVIDKGVAESGQTNQQFQGIIQSIDKNAILSQAVEQHISELREIVAALNKGSEHLSSSAERLLSKL
ncbi:MAG: globin-coupled sensor protein [Sporolactobacillus sp.]